MAHNIEIVDGVASMAYTGEKPWHGLGKAVPADLTPAQMCEAAGVNWTVTKKPLTYRYKGEHIKTGDSALVRETDGKYLDTVSNNWNVLQNSEAFEFFAEYVELGDMEMNTAGSLQEGRIVWALAKIKESFELFHGDVVESYMLFTNYHKFGFATDIRSVATRVVCNNTLSMALKENSNKVAKVSHAKAFDAERVKKELGMATNNLQRYKEVAEFLGSVRATKEGTLDILKKVFPLTSNKKDKDISRNASRALSVIESQPGANYAEGSYWQVLNAITYMTNHVLGDNTDTRLTNLWYGSSQRLNENAIDICIEQAKIDA